MLVAAGPPPGVVTVEWHWGSSPNMAPGLAGIQSRAVTRATSVLVHSFIPWLYSGLCGLKWPDPIQTNKILTIPLENTNKQLAYFCSPAD